MGSQFGKYYYRAISPYNSYLITTNKTLSDVVVAAVVDIFKLKYN